MSTIEQRHAALASFLIQLAKAAEALAQTLVPDVPAPTVAPVVNQEPATPTVTVPVPNVPVLVTIPESAPVVTPPVQPKPATPPATPKPVAGPPRPLAAPPRPNRLPQVDAPVRETISEIAAFDDAVARDKDPKPATVTPVNTLQTVAAPLPAPGASATPVVAEGLASREELAIFKNRAGKLMRDKLEKEGGLKNASAILRDHILKLGGATAMEKIRKDKWEEILSTLEKATPAEAVAIVKG